MTFRLCAITNGTASAPHLAARALKQLAIDDKVQFPKASKIALKDIYVDDVFSGASDIEEGTSVIIQLCQLLQKGGFAPIMVFY